MKIILVAVDFSDLTPLVVEQAARIAEASATAVHLLHVGPPEADFLGQQIYRKELENEDKVPERLRESYEKLRLLANELRGRGIETRSTFLLGKSIETLLAEAERLDAEMIVMGSHKTGALYRLLGSTSEGVLRGASCPVLVVPPPRPAQAVR